ncbi:MAG: hypothetical protein JNM99_14570 [Verrucomicrobiaceae bacterium]|nr:hypothetical protein [Verrucomicrobiaceae bacterium]
MSFWTNKDRSTILSDAEELAHTPERSPWTKYILGFFVPSALVIYSLYSINRGSITLPGSRGSMTITGDDVTLLAVAYVALAVFLHCHWVWCLHERLWIYAGRLKVGSLLVFLPCFLVVIYHQLGF